MTTRSQRWVTATIDADGTIACPWDCGLRRSDSWDISEGDDRCEGCGGKIEYEAETVRTLRAFRGTEGPAVDPARLRALVEDDAPLRRYLERAGWTHERPPAPARFTWYAPPAGAVPGALTRFPVADRPRPDGVFAALGVIAAHEGRTPADVLASVLETAEDDDG